MRNRGENNDEELKEDPSVKIKIEHIQVEIKQCQALSESV